MTARWVVEEVGPARDLRITWQPISLLFKNRPAEDSPGFGPLTRSHGYLRVMEAAPEAAGNDAVWRLYWQMGARIHHDKELEFDPADALRDAGLDASLAAAANDERWDAEIERRMSDGLALVGEDVGTPILAFADAEGDRVGIFGPVITRIPPTEQSLHLWDCVVGITTTPGFWELKKTRTERPDPGERPRFD